MWLAGASLGAGLTVSLWILSRAGGDLTTALSIPWHAHLLATAALALDVLARGARVAFVARGLGIPLAVTTSVRAQLAGDALGAATPFRIGSDPAKIGVLKGGGVGFGASGALLLAEMASEASVLVVCAAVIVLGAGAMRWAAAGLFGYAAVVSAAGLFAITVFRAPDAAPPRLWTHMGLARSRWASLRQSMVDFRERAKALRTLPRRWAAAAMGATLAHMFARVAVLPILVMSLAGGASGLEPGMLGELILRPFFVLYATALLPPPGGGGGVEVTFAAVLSATLGATALAATVLWWRVYTFYLSAAIGGLLLFLPSDTERSAKRHRVFSATVVDT